MKICDHFLNLLIIIVTVLDDVWFDCNRYTLNYTHNFTVKNNNNNNKKQLYRMLYQISLRETEINKLIEQLKYG